MKSAFIALSLATILTALPASAAEETQNCVRLRDIQASPTIDENTILLKMRGDFKRVDLAGACPGVEFSGFAQVSQDGTLCRSTTLRVLQTGGMNCTIDRIVTISEAEARELEARR